MKTTRTKFAEVFFATICLSAIVLAQSSGTYTIPSSVIGASGGLATGDTLTLDSTVGEPVAGTTSSGDAFDLLTGFMNEGSAATAPTLGISGTVTYGNAFGQPKYISNVTVTGTGSPNVFTTTAGPGLMAGQYTLSGFGSGSYTVTLSKTTGQNGITSNDAARIAQHVAGTVLFTTTNQKVAADTSGNGVISSNDAAMIARFVAGLGSSIGNTSRWRFYLPPGPTFPVGASPTSRTYASVTSNLSGEDYIGLLIGEVTGNWTPSAARPIYDRNPEKTVTVGAPHLSSASGKELTVPITVNGVSAKAVISYEFDLIFDPAVMQPAAETIDLAGTSSSALSAVVNATEPGRLRVVVYGATPIDKNGILLNLKFTVVGMPGSLSPLTWEHFMLNEGEPQVNAVDGQVELR